MSYKPNTYKLLIFLYSPSQSFFVKKNVIADFLPELSSAGLRSLLTYSSANNWIQMEKNQSNVQYRLTKDGERTLEASFPCFYYPMKQWQGELVLINFLTPPKGDSQFRYLRRYLLANYAQPISRGCYVMPKPLYVRCQQQLTAMYRSAVMAVEIKEWIFGDDRSLVIKHFGLTQQINVLSGLSKQIEQLLNKNILYSAASQPQKNEIHSVFHSLCNLIQKDSGLLKYYFTQVEDTVDLLSKFQKLFNE